VSGRRLLITGALVAGACAARGGAAPGPTAAGARPPVADLLPALPSPLPPPPSMRLPTGVRPTRYQLELSVTPASDGFAGVVDIELALAQPTAVIWLNATDLVIDSTELTAGGVTSAARAIPGGPDFVGFVLGRTVAPGSARLRIAYRGRLSPGGVGLFKARDGDAWYAFTQFEATYARRAIPCFDEPEYKVPWRVVLRVPPGEAAFANTPVETVAEVPGGPRALSFAETRPLPSYLVAFAVGPLEAVPVGNVGKKATPVRVVVPRGRAREAAWAAQIAPELVTRLEGYLGAPFPYPKLDLVAMPVSDFGAMENAGLITFEHAALLGDPETLSVRDRRDIAHVMAHEIAHQWLGDLVTMAWWDDLWLNEAFANWLDTKIVGEWKPDWKADVEQVARTDSAMETDVLASARRVHNPIATRDDILNAFDGITYDKGAAVLAMTETWVGPDAFRRALQAYLGAYAWKNATTADFVAAVSEAAALDASPVMASFLDQEGVPLVSMKLSCAKGKPPSLRLDQRRFLPAGARAADDGRRWKIPVCVRYGAGGTEERMCSLLDGAGVEMTFAQAKACPDWVLGNDGAAGYYRVRYQGDLLGRLARRQELTVRERLAAIDDLDALVLGGALPAGDALAFVPAALAGADPRVVAGLVALVDDLWSHHLVPAGDEVAFAAWVEATFGERARALGWIPRPEEEAESRLLRAVLVPFVALRGADRELRAQAVELTGRWLGDRKALDPDARDGAVLVAARSGDAALWERMQREAVRSANPADRALLLGALARFPDARLTRRALEGTLGPDADPREAVGMYRAAADDDGTLLVWWDVFRDGFDHVAAHVPDDLQPRLLGGAARFCDETHRAEVAGFMEPRADKLSGGRRVVEQTLEQIDLCVAARKRGERSVAAFLRKGKGP
jgi:aminopeptidase N